MTKCRRHDTSMLPFLILLIVTTTSSYPQSRKVKEGIVGEKMEVDKSDGEEWYPVEGGQEPGQNGWANDLVEAVRDIFLKWGYSAEVIPQPFGNADPAVPFRSTPEFINVLQLLVEKLPTELDLPILHILQENGVTELRIPKGSYENSIEIRKIDEIISQIQHLTGGQSAAVEGEQRGAKETKTGEKQTKTEEDFQVDGKYDPVRQAQTLCWQNLSSCPASSVAKGKLVMNHPTITLPPGKLLQARPNSPTEDAAQLTKDKKKLEVLIQEVKKSVNELGPKGNDFKAAADLTQISQLVTDVESIAERNVKAVAAETPCKGSDLGIREDVQKMDELIHQLEKDQVAIEVEMKGSMNPEKAEAVDKDMAAIDQLIKEMQSKSTPVDEQEFPEDHSHTANEINRITAQMQKHQNHVIPEEHVDRSEVVHQLKAIDSIINELQAFQAQPHPHDTNDYVHLSKSASDDIQQIDQVISDIRNYQAEFHPEQEDNLQGKNHEDLSAIDSLINDIKNYEAARSLSELNSHHAQPAHDEQTKTMNSLINSMEAHSKEQLSAGIKPHDTEANRKFDHDAEVRKLDELIHSMKNQVQIPLETEHVEDQSDKIQELDYVINQMKNVQSPSEVNSHPRQPPHEEEINALNSIINSMEAQKMDQMIAGMKRQQTESDQKLDHSEKIRKLDELIHGMKSQVYEPLEMDHVGDHSDKIQEIDSVISQMKNAQGSQINDMETNVRQPDTSELETTMNQIRQFQAQAHEPVHTPRHGTQDAEVKKLDELINDIQRLAQVQHEVEPSNSAQVGAIDNMIADMEAEHAANSVPTKQHTSNVPHSDDQLKMIDNIIREITEIGKQEEKHLEDESQIGKNAEIENIMKNMNDFKTKKENEFIPDKTQGHVGTDHPNMNEINRILNNLERESAIERDLQTALDVVKHPKGKGKEENHQGILEKTNLIVNEMERKKKKEKLPGLQQSQTNNESKEIEKILKASDLKRGKEGRGMMTPEMLKEDKFNSADAGYLRRLKELKSRMNKLRTN